eukprot:305008_1
MSLLCRVLILLQLLKCLFSVDPNSIKTVHVIASNHLDVGFTDYIVNVINEYWDNYFPSVLNLKQQFKSQNISFSYLTQPYLISLYLDECPINSNLHCPTEKQKEFFVNNYLLNNDIPLYFHAFPFNSVNELYDKSLFEYNLYLTLTRLPTIIKKYANKTNENITFQLPKVLSQRDVPGITRSVIPLLIKYNISAISIGVNPWSPPPSITNNRSVSQSQIFKWSDKQSNTSIITMIHAGGYGGIQLKDALLIEGYDETIVFDFHGDNGGPKTFTDYQKDIKQIQNIFTNANVYISTLNNYINNLLSRQDIIDKLPVITSEISDTWQYGGAADAKKLQKFRIATNLRRQYLNENKVSLESDNFNNFSRFLSKNGEHTFGAGVHRWNQSINDWNNSQLNAAIKNNNADITEFLDSWYEMRMFGIDYALDALKISTDKNEINLYNDIMKQYNAIDNVVGPNDLNNENKWKKIANKSEVFSINNLYNIQFNALSGALNNIYDIRLNINYINDTIGSEYGYGLFYYTTRTEQDFAAWVKKYQYTPQNCSTAIGFCKNGLQQNANPIHMNLKANLVSLYQNMENQNLFIEELNMGQYQNELKEKYGGSSEMYMIYNFSTIQNEYVLNVDITLILINKTFTRIPENLWIIFNGNIDFDRCLVVKLNESIDVNDVILNGTQHLHVIESDFDYGNVKCMFNDNKSFVSIQGIDTGNIAFVPDDGTQDNLYSTFSIPLNVSNDLQKGFGFYLFDNVWNTNYAYWFPFDEKDVNSTFRFNAKFMTNQN